MQRFCGVCTTCPILHMKPGFMIGRFGDPHHALFAAILCIVFAASSTSEQKYFPETDPLVLKKLEQWQDLKFGLLMHWGPYSQWGIVESWSICAEDEGWCGRNLDDYILYKSRYEQLVGSFNPRQFDPVAWAAAARKAGMRYVVFTTKHHDGFCMFDTRTTTYKITSDRCPFHDHPRANAAKEIFSAFRKEGLWTGAYFSKPDWHSPDYWWPNFATPDRNVNYDPERYPDRWNAFVRYTHDQILELMSDYGRMDILWLDGGWVSRKSVDEIREGYAELLRANPSGFVKKRIVSQDIQMKDLVQQCREKQPGLIVVDRAVEGPYQNYLTPENMVPDRMLPYPWESCIIAGGGWSWVKDARYKTSREVIEILADIVSKGGNLLLNIAPGPDGTWDKGAYRLLDSVGRWMDVNGKAIYGTRPLPPYGEGNLRFTRSRSGDTTYVICLGRDNDLHPPDHVTVAALHPSEHATMTMLGSQSKLHWRKTGDGCVIDIPAALREHPPCSLAWAIRVSDDREGTTRQ
jgi:alpha-L-fucosidase